MSFSYVWPVALIVCSNTLYQICAKGVPKEMDVMASMTVTYLVGAACSILMFFVMNGTGASLFQEYGKLNPAPVLLGVSVVGLETGFIYAFKAGWPVSTTQIISSALLTIVMLFIGALLYHETITPQKLMGAAITLLGLYFLTRA